ncbi:MAG: oxidoreductase [Planctomycetaceae bacterium]|nr:oxidoreductase [Planctomycetaceae bacterium]
MSRLRVGVIGAGHLGRIHTRLLKTIEDVELVGVVDPISGARQRIAEEYNVETFEHHDALVGKIDAAIVATTTEHHHAVGTDVLRQGAHLFIEKPISTTVSQADELVALARVNGLVLQVGHVERFNPAFRAVAKCIRRPRYLEAVRMNGYTFRSTDIGVVLDLMIHDLDLVLSMVRSEVVEVDALGSTIFGPHEDMAHAHLRFANGCIANLNASRTSFYLQRQMQILTDRAYGSVDFAEQTAKLVRPSKEVLRGEIQVQSMSIEERERVQHNLFTDLLPVRELPVEDRNAILDEQHDFVECIRKGRRPRVCGEQGRYCLSIAEKILERIRGSEREASTAAGRLLLAGRFNQTAASTSPESQRQAG